MRNTVRRLLPLVEHTLDSEDLLEERAHGRRLCRVIDVHVCDLMVGDGTRGARAGVEQFIAELIANGEHAVPAQDPVHVDGPGDVDHSVLRQQDDARASRLEVVDEPAAHA
ncbi:MAG: hypothetical protein EXQ51_04785 [Acidobacteria bacterium]|nr:hypothetical protein [Acidobacteriota bacterium]